MFAVKYEIAELEGAILHINVYMPKQEFHDISILINSDKDNPDWWETKLSTFSIQGKEFFEHVNVVWHLFNGKPNVEGIVVIQLFDEFKFPEFTNPLKIFKSSDDFILYTSQVNFYFRSKYPSLVASQR